jgi:hypothetical protein
MFFAYLTVSVPDYFSSNHAARAMKTGNNFCMRLGLMQTAAAASIFQ